MPSGLMIRSPYIHCTVQAAEAGANMYSAPISANFHE